MARAANPEEQVASFMAKYTPEIADLAEAILNEMRRLYPSASLLAYDNYNALAIGFGPTERASDAIFSIALYPRWVSLFFLQAKGLPDPDHLLKGSGTVAKHVVLPSPAALLEPALQDLMNEALHRARVPFNPQATSRLIIKSISAKQRPRRPVDEQASTVTERRTTKKTVRKKR
jgi:hypothetical protein